MTREPAPDSLPSYLAGTLLLRGRKRWLWTLGLLVLFFGLGAAVQQALGHYSAVVVAPVSFVFAWLWGKYPGAVFGVLATFANAVLVRRMGLDTSAWESVVVDAAAIGAVSLLVGHVGAQLERALGAGARAAQAYDELELAARERMLTITDQVPIGLYRTTPDGRIIGGNDALMKILGFADKQEMLAANVLDYYVDASERSLSLPNELSGEQAWESLQLRRADGSIVWVRDWAVAVFDESGEPMHFDGVLEDITGSHQTDELFRAAFEHSPYGMAISRSDGYLVRGNDAVSELLRRPLDQLTNIHFSQFTFEEEMDITPAAMEKAMAGEAVRYEKRLRRHDGSFFWALISLAPIDDGSDPPLLISHVIDITERRRAQEALENLVRSKDELIASVSHELRTPLTVVHGLAQELDTSWMSFSIPEQKEFISMIAQQSAEVAHIVEDLLVAARADIGKLPIHAESLDVRDQLDAVLPAVPDMTILPERVGESTPVAFADPNRVRQIIRNLLSNATRYGGPAISVRYGSSGTMAWVEVRDNGAEIPRSEVAKIFQPYERAHDAAGQPMSVGLGLTVSRTLADLMGGALSYRFDDQHSIFRLELPVPGSVRVGGGAGTG